MTIGELLNNMAQKAGIAADNAELKTLLASPELATITVPDPLVTSIENGLLSIEAAKNNHPEIKKVYTAQAYDGMDKHLIQILGSDTLEAADLEEIKAEKSTSKKYEIVIAKLKAAKGKATGADKDAINKQIADAHEAARLAKLEVETAKKDGEQKLKGIELKYAKRGVLSTYKTIYDELPPAAKIAAMEALIDNALQDKKADFTIDEQGNLQLVSKDGTSNVFGDNHVQLTPQSFLDKTFAPILKVANTQKSQQQTTQRQQQAVKTASTDAERHVEATADFIKSHTDKVLADMAATPSAMI